MSQLCERIVEQMLPLAHERGLSIALDVEPGLIVMGSFDHLLRALLNLVDNAIKYAAARGQITFDAHKLEGTCRIRVSNDGGPLDAALVARVGDRFLRGDSGRSSDTGGVGLGLAIAAEIARRHRGSLTLAGKSGGGAVATLTLPSAPARTLEPKRPVASIRA